ncbi:MAG: LamG domain-containing protein [Candidatus Micrarchaeaceae archaeon]|nr:LamG domain-containing protein [Candidatus Marsarchaeota archaeon]
MEYLMTYGWAILIIAVVLAALFELGVFNPMTFAPKASPGSCQVVRPEGPGTTAFISLAGECNGEIPQYVASFNGGSSTEINVDSMVVSNTAIAFTVSLWIYVPPSAPDSSMLIVGETSNSIADGVWGLSFDNYPDLYFGYECDGNDGATTAVKQGTWYYVVGVYKSGHGATYIDGINETSGSFGLDTNPGALSTSLTIGNGATCSYAPPNPFIGYASNLQIYNTPLSANDIKALYDEGIGGAPIKIQNLVGWWPLNGNANDYSGNGNNGVPTNVIYTSNWYSGYSAP